MGFNVLVIHSYHVMNKQSSSEIATFLSCLYKMRNSCPIFTFEIREYLSANEEIIFVALKICSCFLLTLPCFLLTDIMTSRKRALYNRFPMSQRVLVLLLDWFLMRKLRGYYCCLAWSWFLFYPWLFVFIHGCLSVRLDLFYFCWMLVICVVMVDYWHVLSSECN